MSRKSPDIITTNHGSMWCFLGHTERGQRWLDDNVLSEKDAGEPVFAEYRYGPDIALGALDAGLLLQDSATGYFAERPPA